MVKLKDINTPPGPLLLEWETLCPISGRNSPSIKRGKSGAMAFTRGWIKAEINVNIFRIEH
jgi:hypothetical protein